MINNMKMCKRNIGKLLKSNMYGFWIDTHAHLHVKAFDKDDLRKKLIKNMFGIHLINKPADRVGCVVNVAINYESNEQELEMITKSKYRRHMYMVCGIHPNSVEMGAQTDDERYAELRDKYLKHKKCIGIGETGLDYKRVRKMLKGGEINWDYVEKMVPRQEEWFRKSISLSLETGLPLVLHIRNCVDQVKEIPAEKYNDAYKDAIAILSEYFDETDIEIRGICHCFNGSREQMNKLLRLVFMIGVNGSISQEGNEYLRSCIEDCPINRIVLETDCPYLAPITLEGEKTDKTNNPLNIPLIGQWVAQIKGMPVVEVQRITTENAVRVFSIL